MVRVKFWLVFSSGEIQEKAYAKVQLEQIDTARHVIEKYPEVLILTLVADDIENSLVALRSFYRLCVRYMSLTHKVILDCVDAAMGSS